jgi:SAM-dependent MidA family methyltransferase
MTQIDPNDPQTWPPSARDYLARREPVAAETPTRQQLAEYVRAQGRVTFAEFMRQALYDPEEGYYRSPQERIGQRGDFVTSPETHPAFGAMIARWLRTRWQALGEPLPFIVVEAGGGTGAAAEQILAAAERWPAFAEALRYVLLEPGAAASARQRDRLARFGERVQWASAWQDLPTDTAAIWANEVLDALPFHRVRREGNRLVELWVACRSDGAVGAGCLYEEPGPLSTSEIAGYFDRLGIQPAEGIPVEVNLEASDWLRAAAGAISRGFILLLDYGASADALYSDAARAGTLRTYHRHMLGVDPFVHIGEQDLTADVDFTTLLHVAEDAGLQVAAFTDQRRFLLELGLRDWLRRPPAPGETGHLRLLELIDPSGLGRIKVLELHKGDTFRASAAGRTRVY